MAPVRLMPLDADVSAIVKLELDAILLADDGVQAHVKLPNFGFTASISEISAGNVSSGVPCGRRLFLRRHFRESMGRAIGWKGCV